MTEGSAVINPSGIAIDIQGVSKSFGATHALKNVSLKIPAGAIIGLVGENGAGKSTLGKIIAGVFAPDSGSINFFGEEKHFGSPNEALKEGVALIAQEILLVPDLTVEENIFLGHSPQKYLINDKKSTRAQFEKLLSQTKFDLDPSRKVSSLRLADQQKVEILRAISRNTKILIMDEPSATLTADELNRLHETIQRIAASGTTILLISHFLEEVLKLTSHVVIMRDGEVVRSGPTKNETVDSLVAGMVGRQLETQYDENSSNFADKPILLEVKGLSRGSILDNINLQVREGEILGLVGLVGSGRTEIARAIFGADEISSGEKFINGKSVIIDNPAQAIQSGLFMIPESRKDEGLFLRDSIENNLMYSSLRRVSKFGFLKTRELRKISADLARRIDLRFRTLKQPIESLSGGNQQKVLFGRAMDVDPLVLIVDEPTRGVDIGAKRAIHELLRDMNLSGKGVLFISSEIEEALGVCNRVLVIQKGKIVAEFNAPFDQHQVVGAFFNKTMEINNG